MNKSPEPPVEKHVHDTASLSVRAFATADDVEALLRAQEVSSELLRLDPVLRGLSDSELRAYATRSLPIATFLHSKGHAFAVLTEDMLAAQFRGELGRREQPDVPQKHLLGRSDWKWIVDKGIALLGPLSKVFHWWD
jgi:hypothetical protein